MCWRAQERRRGTEAPAGSAHIQQHCASLVNAFCVDALNPPYANLHRPCFFPETITDAKGKEYKRYRDEDMNTPYEKRKSLSSACQRLKPGVTVEHLDAIALQIRDNATA
jgi:hypothetical protein